MATIQEPTGWALYPPGSLTDSETSAHARPGTLCSDTVGNIYRYVKVVDATAGADGSVFAAAAADMSDWKVTADRTGGSNVGTKAVGVGISTIAENSFGWILVSGYHDAVSDDDGVSAGDYLVIHTVDHEADTFADGEEEQVFGQALAASASDACAALVSCL